MNLAIGKTLAMYRKKQQLTQKAVADALGLSKSSISKWETEVTYPDISLLPNLASLYRVSIDELLNYSPQLTKAEIEQYYRNFSRAFTTQSFYDVKAKIQQVLSDHPTSTGLQLQMTLLLINHLNLVAPERLAKECQELIEACRQIKEQTRVGQTIKLATNLQALLHNMLGEFDTVLDLLGNELTPYFSEAALLATAYSGKQHPQKAYQTLQVEVYQNLIGLVGNSGSYLAYLTDVKQVDTTVARIQKVATAYELSQLSPYGYLSFLFSASTKYLALGCMVKALKIMQEIEQILALSPPIVLEGDYYFDAIMDWLEKQHDFNSNAPRDKELVIQSIQQFFAQQEQLYPELTTNTTYNRLLKAIEKHLKGV